PAVPLAATGGGSRNPVVFTSLTDAACRIHQNRWIVMLDTGDCTVAADQAGNADYLPAPRITRAFRIVHNEMPQPFAIPPRDGVRISSLVESAPVAVYGITGPVDVVVEGGEISIGCNGTWVPGPAQLSPGQEFCVRHVAAGRPLAEARTRVYVGMSSADFVSRTGKAEPRLVLEASTSPSRYRSEVSFTVTAVGAETPVTGTVGLRFGPVPIIGCEALAFESNVATCRTDSLAPGVRDVVARFDENWAWAEASLSHYVRPELRTSFRDPTATGTAAFYMATNQGGLALVSVSRQGAAPPAVLQPEGEGWSIAHFADFNADGKADLLFVNADGRHALWLMDGEQVLAKSDLIRAVERLTVPMVGDFNGDGRDDLLVKDAAGRYAIWLVNGTDVTARNALADPGPDLVPTALADLDADGVDDLVLERADGRFRLVLVKNGQAAAFADFERPGPGYSAAQFADFDGDYRTDLWFRGPAGDVVAWRMDGVTIRERAMVIGPTAWRVSNVADFDTDGADDFLLTDAEGGVMIWAMDGLKVASGAIIVDPHSPPAWQRLVAADGTPIETRPADWRVVQVGDFDGDGLPDLAFLHKGGTLVVVILKGLEVASSYAVTPPAGWNLVED
ncbi:MAG TPA: VCBS repeat-containing protein, partial [Usitatibacteraceae bacterium]|nr:VCBS repeat-containing protein [Usitatibacteraceae bacterium]